MAQQQSVKFPSLSTRNSDGGQGAFRKFSGSVSIMPLGEEPLSARATRTHGASQDTNCRDIFKLEAVEAPLTDQVGTQSRAHIRTHTYTPSPRPQSFVKYEKHSCHSLPFVVFFFSLAAQIHLGTGMLLRVTVSPILKPMVGTVLIYYSLPSNLNIHACIDNPQRGSLA